MRGCLRILPILFVAALSSSAVAQSPSGAPQTNRSTPAAIQVQPSMIILDQAALIGLRVFVPAAQIVRVIGPRVVVVSDTHLFSRPILMPAYEELMVVLPTRAAVGAGEVIKIVGTVRTISGVRRDDDLQPLLSDLSHAMKEKRYRAARILLAESAQTLDGVELH